LFLAYSSFSPTEVYCGVQAREKLTLHLFIKIFLGKMLIDKDLCFSMSFLETKKDEKRSSFIDKRISSYIDKRRYSFIDKDVVF
jgi:hypothetical protein